MYDNKARHTVEEDLARDIHEPGAQRQPICLRLGAQLKVFEIWREDGSALVYIQS